MKKLILFVGICCSLGAILHKNIGAFEGKAETEASSFFDQAEYLKEKEESARRLLEAELYFK